MINLFKFYLRPGSPFAVVLLFGIGIVWLYRRPAQRAPRRYLLVVLLGFWFAATPMGAGLLTWGLGHGLTSVTTRDEARGADTVVVLGGGARTFTTGEAIIGVPSTPSILRALEGARVAKLIRARLVIASGGRPRPDLQLRPESQILREALIEAGVGPERIVEESTSKTTREQALFIAPILRAHGVGRLVLVTSPTHMRRALAAFRSEGLYVVPSVAAVRSTHIDRPLFLWPNAESLSASDDTIYDYAATLYYWWRGWTK